MRFWILFKPSVLVVFSWQGKGICDTSLLPGIWVPHWPPWCAGGASSLLGRGRSSLHLAGLPDTEEVGMARFPLGDGESFQSLLWHCPGEVKGGGGGRPGSSFGFCWWKPELGRSSFLCYSEQSSNCLKVFCLVSCSLPGPLAEHNRLLLEIFYLISNYLFIFCQHPLAFLVGGLSAPNLGYMSQRSPKQNTPCYGLD